MVQGLVCLLGRFPVKSTTGESVLSATVGPRGFRHDREWAVYTADGGIASGKTTRRFRKIDGLLAWRSAVHEVHSEQPMLRSPDGDAYRVDDPAAATALSRAFGQPLGLRPETSIRHHDESGVHLITTSSIRHAERLAGGPIDARRLRANIVLDTPDSEFPEDAWIGAQLAVGPEVVLQLGLGMPRCVMIDLPQAGGAARATCVESAGMRTRPAAGHPSRSHPRRNRPHRRQSPDHVPVADRGLNQTPDGSSLGVTP